MPAPRQLTLERQLNKSILIGWTSPDCPPGQIEMYHVYVDGFLRTTVRSTDKTKALVEGVDGARVSQRLFITHLNFAQAICVLFTTRLCNFTEKIFHIPYTSYKRPLQRSRKRGRDLGIGRQPFLLNGQKYLQLILLFSACTVVDLIIVQHLF